MGILIPDFWTKFVLGGLWKEIDLIIKNIWLTTILTYEQRCIFISKRALAVHKFMALLSKQKLIFFIFFSVTPISKKRNINTLIFADYFIILLFYFLLAFTGIFAFEEINDLYTLNFQPDPEEPWYMKVIHYFLSLFPVFTLSTNFPIIAITLRNNLQTLFLTEGKA